MKIEFLTHEDPLYVMPFFDEFFRRYAGEFTITSVSCCRMMGNRSRPQLLQSLFWLYGPFGLVRLLARLAKGRLLGLLPFGRGARAYHTLRQLCRAYGVRYTRIGNPNSAEYRSQITDRAPDLIVSVACPYILKDATLSLPPLGCINIHHAMLPKYQGMMPTFWQMYHNEKRVGVTIHYMSRDVDSGEALLQEQLEILPGESLDRLIRRSKRHGAHCVAKTLRALAGGSQAVIALEGRKPTRFTFPTIAEIRDFRRRGFKGI